MKPALRAFVLAWGLISSDEAGWAQPFAHPSTDSLTAGDKTEIQRETLKLLIADVKESAIAPVSKSIAPAEKTADAVTMDPYIVREPKVPVLIIPHYESPLYRFIKTGTIFKFVGEKVTTKVQLDLTESSDSPGSTKKPGPKVDLSVTFSW